jgi:hypothetical protein
MFAALAFLVAFFSNPTANADIPAQFAARSPTRYEAVSSVVMQYRWLKFPALGAMSVDTRKRHFALAGLSQMGLEVFSLRDKNGITEIRMPAPVRKRNPQIAEAAIADVRSMFFDLTPAPDAERRDTRRRTIFSQETPEGTLQHRFDKDSGLLAEKRLVNRSRCPLGRTVIWVVRYDDYAGARGKTYPRTVRFKHRKLHYAISTRIRKMRIKK